MKPTPASPIKALGLFIWFLAAAFFLYEFFLRTFIGTISHQIIPDLHLSVEEFAILGSSYYITYGIMQIPVGILADKFGVRIMLTFATAACALATIAFAYVDGFMGALTTRIIIGFASSFAFISLLVVAVNWFPRRYFAFFAGASQFIGTLGPLLAGGPLVLLLAYTHNEWRMPVFWIGIAGLVLAGLIAIFVRDNANANSKLIKLERHAPLLDSLKRLAKNPQAWAIALYSGNIYLSISFYGVIWGTEYLQTRGLTQASAASIISMAWIGYAIACPLLGAFSDIAKRRKPVLIGCGVLGIIVSIIIARVPINAHWVYILLFLGLGFAASGQNVGFAAITEQVDANTKASALGLNNGMITTFDAILPPLFSLLITLPTDGSRAAVPQDFIPALSCLPFMFFIATIIAVFFIKETYCKPQKEALLLDTTDHN